MIERMAVAVAAALVVMPGPATTTVATHQSCCETIHSAKKSARHHCAVFAVPKVVVVNKRRCWLLRVFILQMSRGRRKILAAHFFQLARLVTRALRTYVQYASMACTSNAVSSSEDECFNFFKVVGIDILLNPS